MDIRQISLDVPYTADIVLPFPPLKKATSIDVDRKTGEIYWTDTSEDIINKGTADGKNIKTIVMHELEMPDGLAIDSTGRKVIYAITLLSKTKTKFFRCTGQMVKGTA